MLKFLMPREDRFFQLFDDLAACTVEASSVFVAMLEHFGDAPAKARRLHEIEHHADEITHTAMELLHRTFVTPFDRDQIHSLIVRLDDVVDVTDSASRRMMLYGIEAPTPELIEMSKVLHHATLEIVKAVHGLRNLKDVKGIHKSCIEINKLENDGDALRDDVVARLFREETHAIELLKWRELYEEVEIAIDLCEDVADVIVGVVLENS
jgi:uncharacterized protein Yka (UPF0111/DUF47 family)